MAPERLIPTPDVLQVPWAGKQAPAFCFDRRTGRRLLTKPGCVVEDIKLYSAFLAAGKIVRPSAAGYLGLMAGTDEDLVWRRQATGGEAMRRLFIGLALLAAGVALVIWGKAEVDRGAASKSWPVVQGKVIKSEVAAYQSTSREKGRTRTTTMYEPRISYTYTVDGRRYTSNQILTSDYSSSSSKRARKLVAGYPVGSTVDVHYDPENPQDAVLEPGASLITYIPMGIGLVILLVGLGLSLKFFGRLFARMLRLVLYLTASKS